MSIERLDLADDPYLSPTSDLKRVDAVLKRIPESESEVSESDMVDYQAENAATCRFLNYPSDEYAPGRNILINF